MDRLIQNEPDLQRRARWRLLVPAGVAEGLPLRAIESETVGRNRGHVWEQLDLAGAARNQRLLNLGNAGPVLHGDKLVVIHDAAVFRTPRNFGGRYALVHRLLSRAMARTGRIATVSEFSRGELSQVLGVAPKDIAVVPNGCDHFLGRDRDEAVLGSLGLSPGGYFLFVGTPAPNKNLTVLLDAFARLDRPGTKLVIAGSLDPAVFGGTGAASGADLIVAPGRSDAQVAALYASAIAHVFPSVYEGFGIPPLEAMASGCRVIASDIPVVREVCAGAASYFPPRDADALAALMRAHCDDPAFASAAKAAAADRLAHFTWGSSARRLIDLLLTR